MDCSDLENSDYYDLIDRTQYDANAGILGNIKNTFSFFTALLGTFSYIFILAEYHLFLLIIIILTPSVRYFYEKKYNILSYRMIRENTEHRRRMSYYFRMLIDADCAKEIRMYRLSKLFTERYAQLKEHCVSNCGTNHRFFLRSVCSQRVFYRESFSGLFYLI